MIIPHSLIPTRLTAASWLLFLLLFTIDGVVTVPAPPSSPSLSCPGSLPKPQCMCIALPSGALQVQCSLDERAEIGSVLAVLAAGKRNYDKIVLKGCHKPVDSLEPLPKLQVRVLEISSCNIAQMHQKAFDALSDGLKELILCDNKLTALPFLVNLRKLESLNLNKNALKDIPEHLFDGLGQLKHLKLKGNRICALSANALNELKSTLELLDLSNNCFAAVPAQNIRNSLALTHLSLSGNQIKEVAQMQFMNLPNLIELRLNSNHLSHISPVGFMNVPQLRHLLLRNNRLATLDMGNLRAFKQLEVIDLNHNNFVKIPSFKDFTNLIEVRVAHNQIKRIDTLTFSANPKLQLISLQNNSIDVISRNSFDALDSLTTLILNNNSLANIERSMFDGIRNLKNLLLGNNSITELSASAFASIPQAVIIDLSANGLRRIRAGTFAQLSKLYLLDLSNNRLASFEQGSFQTRVANVFLDGNNLNCDKGFDWFVSYLVVNHVRTFATNQSEIVCTAPPAYAGVRLEDLMMKKANDTLATSMQTLDALSGSMNPGQKADGNLLSRLIPGLDNARAGSGGGMGQIPVLGSITDAFPALRQVPGMSLLNKNGSDLDSAIGKFADPLVRFASGSQPMPGDVNQLLQSIPNLMVNVPGLGNIDVSKLPPNLVEHVLKGGQVPGIPRETLNAIVKQYMERMYAAASVAQGRQVTDVPALPANVDSNAYLRPIGELPHQFVTSVMQGESLPHLTAGQTKVIKDYYTQRMPSVVGNDGGPVNLTEILSPKVIQMMKLLPPGYNYSQLPPEIMKSVMAGQLPDLSLLPAELQDHLRRNLDHLFNTLSSTPDISIDEILRKLPRFEQAPLPTFSPYDINNVDSELVILQKKDAHNARLYTAIALGLVAATTLVILGLFCFYVKRNRSEMDSL